MKISIIGEMVATLFPQLYEMPPLLYARFQETGDSDIQLALYAMTMENTKIYTMNQNYSSLANHSPKSELAWM